MGPLEIMRRTSSRSGSSFQSFETSGGAFARRWSPPAIIGTASSEKTPLGSELASAQPIGAEAIALLNSLARSAGRSEEHTSELQSLMRTSYAVFCLKKKKNRTTSDYHTTHYTTHQTYP